MLYSEFDVVYLVKQLQAAPDAYTRVSWNSTVLISIYLAVNMLSRSLE